MIEFSYIHIPFCSQKCKYCGFTSFINTNVIEAYISSLIYEIDKKYNGIEQKSLYIGGGTPSLLNLKQIGSIIKKFNINGEITVEVNPENASYEYLSGLYNLGVNRLSIGVESFDDKILSFIGRRHSAKCGIEAVKNAHAAGFLNVSIDLMHALPNQTLKSLKETLKIAKETGAEHISAYGLKIEKNSYFGKYPPELPDDEIQAEMYYLVLDELKSFFQYEISNFAKDKNYISKHNMNYWNQGRYNGFGVSACGFEGNRRYKNTSLIRKYLNNPLFLEEETVLNKKELLEEAIFLGFRRIDGIDISKLNKKYNIDFDKKYSKIIEKYLKTKHILKTKSGYKLSVEGILISNYILCDFLC